MKNIIIVFLILANYSNADWIDDSKELLQSAKETVSKKFNMNDENKKNQQSIKENNNNLQKDRFNNSWSAIIDDLNKAAKLEHNYINAPDSAWFSTDKKDVKKEINEIIHDIYKTLINDDLLKYRNEIKNQNNKISSLKKDIQEYQEKKIGAPEESLVYHTKKQYDIDIKNSKDGIKIHKNEIRIIKKRLKQNFKNVGISLSDEQLDVILSRVDGDDVIQICLTIDTLNGISDQLLKLMQNSNEDLTDSKKYYAMHLITLKLLDYVQQIYINKLNKNYLPKLQKIISDAETIIYDTKRLRDGEFDENRKKIYEKNIETQNFTLEVALFYNEDLLKSKEKMLEAQKTTKDNLKLSMNTYKTVLLSSDLYTIIEDSKNLFNNIMKTQMPEIVPFENIQIQKKYEEITSQLKISIE